MFWLNNQFAGEKVADGFLGKNPDLYIELPSEETDVEQSLKQ